MLVLAVLVHMLKYAQMGRARAAGPRRGAVGGPAGAAAVMV